MQAQPTPGKPTPSAVGGGIEPPPANWRRWARMTAWGVVALGVLVFLFRNSESVPVNFVFFTTEAALWLVLLVVLLIGVILGWTAAWWRARSSRKGS